MHQNVERILIGDRVALYKRGKRGFYQADFHYRGQHRRRSLKTSNQKIAKERAMKLALQIQEGTLDLAPAEKPVSAQQTSLTDARLAYIEYKKTTGKRPKTIGKYNGTLKAFIEFCATKHVVRADQVTLPLIDAYRSHRSKQTIRGKELSPTQLYHDISLLKRFFEWCADRQLTAKSPLAKQTFSRPPLRRIDRVLTLAQVSAILAAAPKRIFRPLAVLAFAGMRTANCRNLLAADVDLEGGWIHVRSRDGAETKVGNEWKVPIHPRLAAALKALPMPGGGYLFTAPPSRKYPDGGHWINTKHLNEDFLKILRKLKIPAGREGGFTIHSLRHFFKSFCVSQGVPREYVDAWQGHSRIRSASDLYVHVFDDESQRLIKTVPFGDGVPAAAPANH